MLLSKEQFIVSVSAVNFPKKYDMTSRNPSWTRRKKMIEHHGHVPEKTSTLTRNGGAGIVNRHDTAAAPVSIDCTDLQQNSRFSTGAYSNFHSSVQSTLNDRSFPESAWRIQGGTYYIRDCNYGIVDDDGSWMSVNGPESWESDRVKEIERYVSDGVTSILIYLHSDGAASCFGTLHPMTLTLGNLSNEYRHTNQARRSLALIPVPIIRRDERLNTEQKAAICTKISFACAQAFIDADLTNTYTYEFRGKPLRCVHKLVLWNGDYVEQVDI